MNFDDTLKDETLIFDVHSRNSQCLVSLGRLCNKTGMQNTALIDGVLSKF